MKTQVYAKIIRFNFVLMIILIVIGFVLFPNQYALPKIDRSKANQKGYDVTRNEIRDELILSKTKKELEKRWAYEPLDQDLLDYTDSYTKKKQQELALAHSKERGQKVLEQKKFNGESPTEPELKSTQSTIYRAKVHALASWAQSNKNP